MFRQVVVGGGVALALGAGVLIGGVTTGFVGAHPAHQTAVGQTPATAPQDGEQADGEVDAAVALPPGSITSAQAQQAATAYVQQTAPYNGQGLQFQDVNLDDENGTVLYTVTFSAQSSRDIEVQVSTSGKVLGVDTRSNTAGGADRAGGTAEHDGGTQTPDVPGADQD